MSAPELKNSPDQRPDQSLIAGRYRLQERIGRGRLGEIFAAVDEGKQSRKGGHHVAVQVVSGIVVHNNRLFNKLKTGYALLRATAHPNIVTYQSLVRDNGRVYLVMELLDGAPLGVLLEDTGALEFDEVLPVLRGISEALQLLHDNGLAHGNLTTANVFLTQGLGVRLLDVVPLDSANAIFGGAATTGRTTAEDDLFALASLAYEMLAGEPSPADPARIADLDDRRWTLLHRVLTRDSEGGIQSVADFMCEFDSPAAERPRAINEKALKTEPLRSLEPAASEPVTLYPEPAPREPVVVSQASVANEPTMDALTDTPRIDDWPDTEPNPIGRWPDHETDQAGPGPMRAILLGTLLAVLGAWYYYGQPEERVADLIAYVDRGIDTAATETVEEPVEELVVDTDNAEAGVAASDALPEDTPADLPEIEEAQPASTQASQAEADVEISEVGPPVAEADVPVADADTVQEQSSDEAVSSETQEVGPPAEPIAEPAPSQPALVSTDAVVSVSERSGVAKVWLRRNGESKLPLVWWTSDSTALAKNDYVAMPEQVVSVGSDEMLHIPLVNDDVPEQRESFYVDIGLRDAQGQIERVASVRIDIDDDDLP